MNKKHYNPGKIWPIIKITVGLIKNNPQLLDYPELLKATLITNIEELNHPETCGNCGGSMVEYIFELDCIDALMLLTMGKEVRRRLNEGLDFTEANKVRVQKLDTQTYAMKSRTTKMSKLGLVAKLIGEKGRQVPGTWVITKRGFDALKGRRVPKSVRVWKGRIEERNEETITLSQAFDSYRKKVEQIIRRNKNSKADYRNYFEDYRQEEWYTIGGIHEGKLI